LSVVWSGGPLTPAGTARVWRPRSGGFPRGGWSRARGKQWSAAENNLALITQFISSALG